MDQPDNFIGQDIPPHRSPELLAMLRKLSIEDRAARFLSLCQCARDTMKAGIKLRNQSFNDTEVNTEFKRIMYDFYRKESRG